MESALARKGWSPAKLARAVGVHPSTLTLMRNGTTRYSRCVVPISRALAIDLPLPTGEALHEWTRLGQSLTAQERTLFIELVRSLRKER